MNMIQGTLRALLRAPYSITHERSDMFDRIAGRHLSGKRLEPKRSNGN